MTSRSYFYYNKLLKNWICWNLQHIHHLNMILFFKQMLFYFKNISTKTLQYGSLDKISNIIFFSSKYHDFTLRKFDFYFVLEQYVAVTEEKEAWSLLSGTPDMQYFTFFIIRFASNPPFWRYFLWKPKVSCWGICVVSLWRKFLLSSTSSCDTKPVCSESFKCHILNMHRCFQSLTFFPAERVWKD